MRVGRTEDATYQRIQAAGGRRAEIYRRRRELADRSNDGLIRDRFPEIPRRVSGYNLPNLLPETGFDVAKARMGSESTCVLVLEATVRLLPDPSRHALLVVGYPDPPTAADHVVDFLDTGPIGLESFDLGVVESMELHRAHNPGIDQLPPGRAWLLAEYGADSQEEVNRLASRARDVAVRAGGAPTVFEAAEGQEQIWEVRRSAIEFTRSPASRQGWLECGG
jgi:FAD/FMN-containing dehydrogenase